MREIFDEFTVAHLRQLAHNPVPRLSVMPTSILSRNAAVMCGRFASSQRPDPPRTHGLATANLAIAE
jgi:hypothetical protein